MEDVERGGLFLNSRQLAKTWPFKRYSAYEREMRQIAATWFSRRGYSTNTRYNFILDKWENWPNNIICEEVAQYIQNEKKLAKGDKPFPLHKYVHHGLSSQAMLFNLIGPLIVRKDLSPLKTVFAETGIDWANGDVKASFEYEDRELFNEDSAQPTSIDLCIEGSPRLFIEAKLVEREFGGCSVFASGDCEGMNPCQQGFSYCYLHHIGRNYWNKLQEYNFITPPFSTSSICPMANNYQFFREVLFALSSRGRFVLLYDERNPTFFRTSKDGKQTFGLWPFMLSFVPKKYKNDVYSVTIQQVVKAIEDNGKHNDWINQFKEKYGLN